MNDLADILAALPAVSSPLAPLPPGACDTHGHVFGRRDRFPIPTGKMGPVAPVEAFLAAHDRLPAGRAILIQSATYGFDNAAMLDGLKARPDRLRGIATPRADATDAELEEMNAAGVRGIRFIDVGPPLEAMLAGSILPFDAIPAFAPRLRQMGWHANVWANCDRLVAAAPLLSALKIPLVIDHMGFFNAAAGIQDTSFQALLGLIRDNDWWIKLCPIRCSTSRPGYEDVRPFHDALIEAAPERMLWGSDWPFLGLQATPPDLGGLADLFMLWTPDAALRQLILVDNPARLYGFERGS